MAFKDITKVLYEGRYKLDYKDKAHRYYVRERANWDLPEDDPKAWGKIQNPKGTTTLLDETLEKKGLMTWPLGLAIRELFGFYDFTNDNGDRMTGFSKEKYVDEEDSIKETGRFVGTMWDAENSRQVGPFTDEQVVTLVKSANEAWQRKKQKGADIGSVVHDAIEHFTQGKEFDIAEAYNWNIKEAWPLPELGEEDQFAAERELAFVEAPADVEMATKAFLEFQKWWLTTTPELFGAEDILLSISHKPMIVGTYDADLGIPRTHHPVYRDKLMPGEVGNKVEHGKKSIRCTTDYKTSNASASESAAAPEGIYYSYFTQLAIYEMMRREMGYEHADDLLCVSARKDGGFSIIFASELDLTMDELLEWAKAVIFCHRLASKTKKGLLAHAPEPAINSAKEAF